MKLKIKRNSISKDDVKKKLEHVLKSIKVNK